MGSIGGDSCDETSQLGRSSSIVLLFFFSRRGLLSDRRDRCIGPIGVPVPRRSGVPQRQQYREHTLREIGASVRSVPCRNAAQRNSRLRQLHFIRTPVVQDEPDGKCGSVFHRIRMLVPEGIISGPFPWRLHHFTGKLPRYPVSRLLRPERCHLQQTCPVTRSCNSRFPVLHRDRFRIIKGKKRRLVVLLFYSLIIR